LILSSNPYRGQTATSNSQSITHSQTSDDYWPSETWRQSTPAEQDLDVEKLDDMINQFNEMSGRVHSVIVIRNGYMVMERYWDVYESDSLNHIFSCTKSFTSALIGIAISQGYIDSIDDPVLDYFPVWDIQNVDERKQRMTIKHLLTMTPGLDWNEWNTSYSDTSNMYRQMMSSENAAKFVLDLPMKYEPGENWVYCTGASQVLSALITEVTGVLAHDFAEENLFGPLGFGNLMWAMASGGVNVGGTQLYVTATDMAKFGYLYLMNGSWAGDQIIPEDYVSMSGLSHFDFSSQDGYGLHWWVKPGYNYYYASGSEGQAIFVDFKYGLVCVFTAGSDDFDPSRFFHYFVRSAAVSGFSSETTHPEEDPFLPISSLILATGIIGVGFVVVVFVVLRQKHRVS
jgi:CubicO group peptidase (beta-lactamase class C family)